MTQAAARGRFITLEGIDGAGKSTHLDALEQWLRTRGHAVVRTREPGGTPLAEQLRGLFLTQNMDALTEALMVFAARRDHVVKVIEPALAHGATVLCDRFTDASFAYQGAGRGFDLTTLHALETWVHGQVQPDLTLWFDVPAAVAAQRRGQVRQPDRLEAEDLAFFERVRAGYGVRAQQAPSRFARVNAQAGPAAVWESVLSAVQAKGWW